MRELAAQIDEAVAAIRRHWTETAEVGIILGTGLGGLARDIQTAATLDYGDIPHFPRSTATSHAGRMLCGKLADRSVVAMEGRFHAYEGYKFSQLGFPVRVM